MPRYWFRQKNFGYGFTPNTWQGWMFLLVFLGLLAAVLFGTDHVVADEGTKNMAKAIGMIVLTIVFLWIGLAKTDPGES